jgi:predicted aspartyl protease
MIWGVVLALSFSSFGLNTSPQVISSAATLADSGSEDELSFELHSKFAAILLRVDVNSVPATMILDTGSSHTILSPRAAGLESRQMHGPVNFLKGSGVTGDARWGKATLKIGSHLFRDQRVVVLDLEDVSRNFGQEVGGLLGQDVLCRFDRLVIDFKRRRIHFDARR